MAKAQGFIDLNQATSVKKNAVPATSSELEFKLITPARVWTLRPVLDSDSRQWFDVLSSIVDGGYVEDEFMLSALPPPADTDSISSDEDIPGTHLFHINFECFHRHHLLFLLLF